jgi:hypothetical protein
MRESDIVVVDRLRGKLRTRGKDLIAARPKGDREI